MDDLKVKSVNSHLFLKTRIFKEHPIAREGLKQDTTHLNISTPSKTKGEIRKQIQIRKSALTFILKATTIDAISL